MGITCHNCRFDNFPFTNGHIRGSYAWGELVKMTKFCHKCGANLFFCCSVCGNLHPAGSTFCSVTGANIEDFQKTKKVTEVMKVTPEDISEFVARKDVLAIAGEVPPMVNRIFFWGSAILILLAMLSVFLSWNVSSIIVLILAGYAVMLILMVVFADIRSRRIRNIWLKEKRAPVQFLVNRFGRIRVES